MTWFRDLSKYRYAHVDETARTLNVGWLTRDHSFARGTVDEKHLDLVWDLCRVIAVHTRGVHPCDLCWAEHPLCTFVHRGERRLLGTGEIRVFAPNGDIFAAPDLVFHYMRDHDYLPPPAFLDALEEGRGSDLAVYTAGLRNRGIPWRDNPIRTEELRRRSPEDSEPSDD